MRIYKKGLARLLVIKDYSFEHVTVKQWQPNEKPKILVIAKTELNNLKQIT